MGIRLSVIGSLSVWRDGDPLPVTAVGSRKGRTLLALLAVQHGRFVAMDQVVDVLWDGSRPRKPAGNTATLVSRLRAVLGAGAVHGDRTGYRLGDLVRVDLTDAGDLVRRAEAELAAGCTPATVRTGRAALDLLDRGPVLDDQPDADWADPARQLWTSLCRRARHTTARASLRAGDPLSAQAVAAAALAADPFDEPACRLLMRAHHAAGEPARALLAYQQLRGLLAIELGADPAAATRALHHAVLRDEVPPDR